MRTLNSGNTGLEALMQAVKQAGAGVLPVENWHPKYCGEMDLVIRRDGSWWHEGTRITRKPLIKLFSRVLRKDADGETYLVTPVEKIKIEVECAPFLAVLLNVEEKAKRQYLFFTTNLGEVIEVGRETPIRVETDPDTLEPTPFVRVRGRLEALINRATFYEMVEHAVIEDGQLGIYAGEVFFSLGPKGILDV